MPVRRDSTLVIPIITASGGIAFLASALWAAASFAGTFGEAPDRWSLEEGVRAVVGNTIRFGLFALHHSLFARAPVKAWVASIVTPRLERSVYVWASSLLLLLVIGRWAPVPGEAWRTSGGLAQILGALQVAGVMLTLVAVGQLDVGRFAGLRAASQLPPLQRTGLYGLVRHPIYFAWLLMVWPTPAMTGSRLTFAALSTLYLVVAVPLEERGLRRDFGPAYDEYRRVVRWRMLPGIY